MTDGKANILIVDDRPEKLLALEAVLEDLGETIVRAYSGREALRQVLDKEFAVILLDVNMPGMDGFDTASLIRQRASSAHTPIIFITAFGDEMHATRGYSLGAVDYIQAPVLPDVLRTKVTVFVELFKKTEQTKRQAESLRLRATQLQKLAAASISINSAPSIERIVQTLTDTARDTIGTHQAITLFLAAEVLGQRRPATMAMSSFSDRYAEWKSRPLQLDEIANSVVARSRTATRLSEEELREHPDFEIVSRAVIPPVRGGMLAAPLLGRNGSNLGVIYLSDRYDGRFTTDDEAILMQLAQMGATAIENAIYQDERESNRLKDEFLATLSHELRTPLNAILGWTQLLSADNSPDEVAHGLQVIERNAKAQAKLVEDLLDISRITSGRLRLNLRPMSLRNTIQGALDVVRPAAEAKRLYLDVPDPIGPDEMVGDPDRLQQVVWNLLSNAVKFTPPGGTVAVEARADEQARIVRIAVRDSGQGIEPQFLPYVFDRFRQADSSSTRSHGGLGIGLTIVRHIVELHGGTVSADSAGLDHGSTFTVELPLRVTPVPGQEFSTPASGNGSEPHKAVPMAPSLSDVHVLLVDDERDARELTATFLRRSGAEVTAVGSCAEVLEILRASSPDILISDIAMPDMDGYDLIAQVRMLPDCTALPAIAVTAYARDEDRNRALAAGYHAHIAKPIDPAELVTAIHHLVAPSRAPQLRLAQ